MGQPWFAHHGDPALLESREEDVLCPRLGNPSRRQGTWHQHHVGPTCPGWQRRAWPLGAEKARQYGPVSACGSCFWEPLATCFEGPGDTRGVVAGGKDQPQSWGTLLGTAVAKWTDRLSKEAALHWQPVPFNTLPVAVAVLGHAGLHLHHPPGSAPWLLWDPQLQGWAEEPPRQRSAQGSRALVPAEPALPGPVVVHHSINWLLRLLH